ncbi:MAG: amidohydrolase family protein [Bifidobacteriaceae bacterium]|jgi:N-acetylglucosamine-6-phosphate deacetylase|nr:amidohydrolase family protein [Bifidobacteriaceae bacterium]
MTNAPGQGRQSEIWAVRGPAVLPVDLRVEAEQDEQDDLWADEDELDWLGSPGRPADEARLTAIFDSPNVAPVLVPDAVVVVAGDVIVSAGDYRNELDMERLLARRQPDQFDGRTVAAIEAARRWDGFILPGLVDIHCHGGGGQSFPDAAGPAEAQAAIREHLRHGTTSLVASLVTDSPEVMLRQTAMLAGLCEAGRLAGIHWEGPFLAAGRAGAQDPAKMQAPSAELARAAAQAARGWLATMTLAPELPGVVAAGAGGWTSAASGKSEPGGADGAVGGRGEAVGESVLEALAAAGAVASFGHTNCSAEEMAAAVAAANAALARRPAGAKAGFGRVATATHLFNGMRPIHHRDPGPAMEAMGQAALGQMTVELVADGVHLDGRLVGSVFALVGWQNVALVTDAMAAAGMPDGSYQLGPAAVTVAGGVARLAGGGSIAGGTAHLIDVVRSAWRLGGVPLAQAVGAASLTPARVLGRADRFGCLAARRQADLILADADLNPVQVYKAGRLVRR